MTCKPIVLPGGVTAIACTRGPGRPHRCAFCSGRGDFQCDFPIGTKKSGTCDAYLCRHHAREKGPGRHWCPTHDNPRSAA